MNAQLVFDFTGPALVNAIAVELSADADGLSCDELARWLHRRKADVLELLRRDERFVRHGITRGCRWTLGTPAKPREQIGGAAEGWPDNSIAPQVPSQNGFDGFALERVAA